jgi:multidrug efflux pump subunit AcrA (membrane-fusion protein)
MWNMNKQWSFVVVAAVGVVAVASFGVAQTPKDSSPATRSPLGATTGDPNAAEVLPKSKLPAATLKSGTARPFSSGSGSFGRASTPAAQTTTSSSQDVDPSLAPFRGSSPSPSTSPGSPSPSGTSIRIEHALVTSLDPIKLPARDAGAIREISVKKGFEVKAEEILGQLDDRDSQIKRKIAELERDAAKLQADSTAQIDAARKGEDVTRENLKANEEIFRKSPGAISPFDMRRSKFEWERALAQIAVAEVEKAVAYATQLAKEGQIEGSDNEIERRKIVAPIDGFVNEVYKHKGEWCQPGDPVLELVRMDRLEIEGFVYAADASPSKVLGKAVDVVVEAAGGEVYRASSTITFASPVLEGSGRIRQFRVSTEIDNKKVAGEDGRMSWLIQPGSEAEMIIHHNPAPKPVVAPKTSIPGGAKSGVPGTKVEAYKPATPNAGAKTDTKSDAKAEKKTDAKDDARPTTKSDPKEDAKSSSKDSNGEVKSETKSDAKGETKTDAKASKSDESKTGDVKESTKSGDSTSPAEKDSKERAKSSTIKL